MRRSQGQAFRLARRGRTLIVCVALLTQFGASLWGAAAARDGMVGCHKSIPYSSAVEYSRTVDAGRETPAQTPAGHDHASCSLCQLGFSFIQSEEPVVEERLLAHRRVSLVEPAIPAPIVVFNRGAPARAPPSQA
jgi:hypothetical protein